MISAASSLRAGEEAVRFTDVTAAAGIDFVETIGDDALTNIVESTGVGCAFLDYDGDGWLDIYLVNGCWLAGLSDPQLAEEERQRLAGATDRLYRNRGDGTFEDVTDRAGLGQPGYGIGVIATDYDADGDTDIYVTHYGPNRLYRNNGDGTFTETAEAAGVSDPSFGVGAAFFDYDGDGRLDLYVGNYLTYDPKIVLSFAPDTIPSPTAYTGQQDRLFRNQGDGRFEDVTERARITIEPKGRAMGLAAFDVDQDGRLDVFVSNDAMENFLLRNRGGGTFENTALLAGVALSENSEATAAMAAEPADYDADGRCDLFVPDMTGSCLYGNLGRGAFADRTARSGVAAVMRGHSGWGAAFADVDLDGRLDLYVSTGHVRHLRPERDVLFLQRADGRFIDVSDQAGDDLKKAFVSRGVAAGDYDNDGDVDLLVTHLNDRPSLLRNDTPRRGRHWLGVRLVGQPPNTDAIGAVVCVATGPAKQWRFRLSGGSYLSQHDGRLHFGLGEHDRVDRLEVTWPDGSRQVLADLPAEQYVTVRQGATTSR